MQMQSAQHYMENLRHILTVWRSLSTRPTDQSK